MQFLYQISRDSTSWTKQKSVLVKKQEDMVGEIFISEMSGGVYLLCPKKYKLVIYAWQFWNFKCTMDNTVQGFIFPLGLEHLAM